MAKNIVTLDLDNTSYEIRPYGVCSTAAGTAAKTVSVSGFTLCTGATVLVQFDNTNTALNPTLNVNSTGAKTIKGFNSDVNVLEKSIVHEFRYDGSNWVLISNSNSKPFSTKRDFVNGTLIKTNIDYSKTSGDPFYGEIKGNTYNNMGVCDTRIQGYIYNNTIINYAVYHLGAMPLPPITAMNIDGYLCFWFPRIAYWHGYSICITTGYNYSVNRVVDVLDVAKPAGTKIVDFEPENDSSHRVSVLTSNTTTFNGSLNGNATSATKATQDGNGNTISSTYLKKTGPDQISGSATTLLVINSTSGTKSGLRFDTNAVSSGWVGYDTTNGVQLFSYKGGSKILGIKDDGTPHFSGNTLLHGANYTNYTVKKDGTGATGTWPISITGNAEKLGNVSASSYALKTDIPVYKKAITTGFIDAFRTQAFGSTGSTNGSISVIRCDTAGVDKAPKYGTGLAIAKGDTHTYLYADYASGLVYMGAGNQDKLNWVKRVQFTDGTAASGTWPISVTGSAATATTATTATKLGTANKGSATQPIYLNGGTPTACTYTLEKSVPSNAVFTDTKVKQTSVVGSSNGTELLPLLLGTSSAFTSGNAGEAYYDSGVTLNPFTNTIAANISGNAQSVDRLNYIAIQSNSTYPTNGTSEYIHFGTINIPTTNWYRSSIMLYFMDYEGDWYQGDILSITSSTNGSGVGGAPSASWQTKRQITTSDAIIISKVSDNKYNLYLEAKGSYTTLKIYYMTTESVGAKDSGQVYELFNASAWTSTAPTITSRSSLVNHSSYTNNINGGAQGSIPYQTGANSTTFLAKGSAGYVLKMNSNATAPVWVSPYATSSTAGGFILGTTVTADAQNTARKYEVKLESSGHAYVNIPWTNTTYSIATKSKPGLMSTEDKRKLDGIATGANNYTHPTDGANTGSFGPSANATPSHGGTFSVPYITVNNKGHVTAVSTKTITLPADSNTDTKVKQTAKSDNVAYPLLLGPSSHTSGNAGEAYYDSGVTLNPSTNTIVANVSGSSGSCTGNAATATCIKKPGSYISALPTSTTTLTAGMTMGLVGSSTTNKPTNATYGNVIQIGGTGHSQLFLEWSGSNTATTGYMYYNSKRDMANTAWGGWKRILDERDLLTAVTNTEIEGLF